MGRPRTVDDELLLDAAQQVMFETGPARFTLERAAVRAGVSAATYVKRFGSKRELLLALNRRWIASIETGLATAVAGHRTAFARLRAAALWGFDDLDSPATAANQLAALAQDRDVPSDAITAVRQQREESAVRLGSGIMASLRLQPRVPARFLGRLLLRHLDGLAIAGARQPFASTELEAELDAFAVALLGLGR